MGKIFEYLNEMKPLSGPNTGCFFTSVTAFGRKKIGVQETKKTFFFHDNSYFIHIISLFSKT